MFNTLKNQLHAFLFPSMHLKMLHLEDEVAGSNDLILAMDEEMSDQRDQKIAAQLAVGYARTEAQEAKAMDAIRVAVIQSLSKRLAERDAEAGKWKGAALELESELKDSFFEIAALNKRIDILSATAVMAQTNLRLVA